MMIEKYEQMREHYIGLCLSCGYEQAETEPDVDGEICQACGDPRVYGIEYLLFDGSIELE